MLLTLQSLIPWPPSSPRLQSAEACFMGGTYPALSLYTGYVPLQVGMLFPTQLLEQNVESLFIHNSTTIC